MVVVVMKVVLHEGEVLQLIRVMVVVVDNVTSNDTTTSH